MFSSKLILNSQKFGNGMVFDTYVGFLFAQHNATRMGDQNPSNGRID